MLPCLRVSLQTPFPHSWALRPKALWLPPPGKHLRVGTGPQPSATSRDSPAGEPWPNSRPSRALEQKPTPEQQSPESSSGLPAFPLVRCPRQPPWACFGQEAGTAGWMRWGLGRWGRTNRCCCRPTPALVGKKHEVSVMYYCVDGKEPVCSDKLYCFCNTWF